VKQIELFQTHISRSVIPKNVLARVTPTLHPGCAAPIVSPSEAKFDLMTGRVTERVISIRVKGEKKSSALVRLDGDVYRLLCALEQRGFHIGLTNKEIAAVLEKEWEFTAHYFVLKSTMRRVRKVLLMTHGILVASDWRGNFRLIQNNELAYLASRWSDGVRAYLTSARDVIWQRAPQPKRELMEAVPLWELEEVKRANAQG